MIEKVYEDSNYILPYSISPSLASSLRSFSAGKGTFSYQFCSFSIQVRRETHIGSLLVLGVGVLWVAYSIFKIVRY